MFRNIVRAPNKLGLVIIIRHYHFELLNLKIGYIKHAALHPNSDKLYVSQIQLSNEDESVTKQVCSSLQQHIPREELEGKLVVVVDNMKKCKFRGEVSEAMIICGKDASEDIVQICRPVNGCISLIGKTVGLSGKPIAGEATLRKIKPKEWDDISSRLYVGEENKVTYREEENETEHILCVHGEGLGNWIPIVVDNLPIGSAIR